jgi:membrane protein
MPVEPPPAPDSLPPAPLPPVWRAVLREMATDRASLVAAGCAFYATLALFPAITMLVFVYGLAFDPVTVEPQLAVLRQLLPPDAFSLIATRVHVLVSQPRATLGLGLAISIAIAFWSASAGTRAMLSALNLAFRLEERRGYLGFYAVGLLMTFGAILGAVLGIALLVFLPVVIVFVGLDAYSATLVHTASFFLLLGFVLVALVLLYRFGPSRRARGRWVTAGALLATVLWLAASGALSLYVDRVAAYDATYGPLGAVVAVMMWFWVTAYVVLLGAELDAQLERRHRQR